MTLLLDHLWQSTMVLAVIGFLTLFFRDNGAYVRHALWTAASVKFLVPFALLSGLGLHLAHLAGLRVSSSSVIETLYAAGQPFSDGPVFRALPAPGAYLFAVTAVWGAGVGVIAILWLSRWLKLRAAVRAARDVGIAATMRVKTSSTQMEPGLVGILRPVLLLPEGIAEKLTTAELQSVLAHEACHKRRHENLWAALHMLVEAVFWFWPPVWWLGTRLVLERERACDEAVVAEGNAPEVYAESILKVCKHYVQSPLACAAGVSGADLKKRMEEIMKNTAIAHLTLSRKALLAASAAALVLTPLAAGLLWAPTAQAATCKVDPVIATHTLPPYPAESQKAGETGAVLLRVTIVRDGHASGAKVTHSSGFARLDERAASYVRQNYRWRPLGCGSAQTDLKVVFRLAKEPVSRTKGAKPFQDDDANAERINSTASPPAKH